MVSSEEKDISGITLENFLVFLKEEPFFKRKKTQKGVNYTYYFGLDLESYLKKKKESVIDDDYKAMDTVYTSLLEKMIDKSVLDDDESLYEWVNYFFSKKKTEIDGIIFKNVNTFANKTLKGYIRKYLISDNSPI